MKEKRIKKELGSPRRPPWLLGGFVALLLLFLLLLQSSNVWKTFSVSSSSDTLLLYALSSLNFIAFVVFSLILARSLLKLRQERRALQLGSKLKTKLLIYFVAVSVLPLIAMAVFSYLFMNRALENWFTQMPKNVVREAGELQTKAIEDQKAKFSDYTKIVAALLDRSGPDQALLDDLRTRGNLALIEITDKEFKTQMSSAAELSSERRAQLDVLLTKLRNGVTDDPAYSDGTGFDVSVAQLKDDRNLVLVPSEGPPGTVGGLVNDSLEEFDRLKSNQIFVRQLGLTTLALLTFLLIFASSWAAFYVAKGLTRPIRALAEGADEIARGNYSHKVDIFAEDELEMLVRAFNAMTSKLQENSKELRRRRRYIETILQSLPTGVISFDGSNRVTTINKAASEMLRLEDAEFVGLYLENLVNEANRADLEKLISRGSRIGHASEQMLLHRSHGDDNGSNETGISVAVSVTALPDGSGSVLLIEDLSELAAAQRAAAWKEVARRMAHEIKNPLTPIQLSAERIAKRFRAFGSNQPVEERSLEIISEGTDTILREVSSLKSMVDEFSRFARLPEAKKEPADLAEVIRRTVALYDDRVPAANIDVSVRADMPEIMADPEQLKRVFVNLIDNAIESFDNGSGNIEISAVHDKERDVLVVNVADDGMGVDPALFGRLFQPYFSTKGRGTGLGLAIVQRIIRDHDGKISAGPGKKSGTVISIELPVQSS
ncbi:MAG: ATP-binding protein [Pyrinomonadaceae bacterium]